MTTQVARRTFLKTSGTLGLAGILAAVKWAEHELKKIYET